MHLSGPLAGHERHPAGYQINGPGRFVDGCSTGKNNCFHHQKIKFNMIKSSALRVSCRHKMCLAAILWITSGFLFTHCQANKAGAVHKKQIRVLMVGGGSSHDFDRWYKQADAATLRREGLAAVRYTSNTDSIAEYLAAGTDVLYLVTNQDIKDPQDRQAIQDFVNAGKGLVIGHAGMWYNWRDWPEYNRQIAGGGSRGHDRLGPYQVRVNNPRHPVMKGVTPDFTLKDERYYYIPDPAGPGVDILASSSVAGSDKIFPSVFVVKHPQARIVGLALGHDADSHDIANYHQMLRNAVAWVARK
jgi:type 1 glutamine amidotransferase